MRRVGTAARLSAARVARSGRTDSPFRIAIFVAELRLMLRRRVAQRRSTLEAFARWVQDQRLAVADLHDTHIAAFIAWRSRARETAKKERATLRRFFTDLRRRGILVAPSRPTSLVDDVTDRYAAYLRTDRGLAENSTLVYRRSPVRLMALRDRERTHVRDNSAERLLRLDAADVAMIAPGD